MVKFKVGSKTTRFDQIRLFKEVLSGFWVLSIDQCFKVFLIFMLLSISTFKMAKSKGICKSIRGDFVGFWLYFADHFLDS